MASSRKISMWNIESGFTLDFYNQFKSLGKVAQVHSWQMYTTLPEMKKFIALYPDLVKVYKSTLYDRDYQSSFIVYAHVKHIVNLCDSGVDFMKAIEPYAVDEKSEYLYPDALALRKREVQEEVAAIGINAWTAWVKTKEYKVGDHILQNYISFFLKHKPRTSDGIALFHALMSRPMYSGKVGKPVLDYLYELDHVKIAELLLDTSITNRINSCDVVDYFSGLIKRDIQEQNKFDFLKSFLIDYKWEKISDTHFFSMLLKDLTSLPTFGGILLSRPESFLRIKQHLLFNKEMYLQFLYWWRVGEDKLYQDLHLERRPGSADYCRVLLLRNIEYQDLLTPVIQRFSSYREVGMLLLYEALARGSKIDAEKLLAASIDHSIVKESTTTKLGNVSQNPASMFKMQEEKSVHTENTSFTDKLSFNPIDFIKYLKDKHTLAEDKNGLYFIQFIDDFVQSLLDLKIITDGRGFKAGLCKAFNIEYMDVENNSSEVAELKSRLEAAEATNIVLERRVDNLERELQEMKALISSLLPSQNDALSMKRIF